MKIRLSYKPPYPPKIFCLTWGGHIQIPFIANELLLLDRNLLSKIKNTERLKDKAEFYWISEFSRVARNLNPILTAYEGCLTRQPNKEEFQEELELAGASLRRVYPTKNVISHSAELSATLFDALARKLERKHIETQFLEQAAALVAHRPSDKDLMPRLHEIIAIGAKAGLTSQSLVTPALLSCLGEKRDGSQLSPGRRILKPKPNYTHQNAYNAISDLQYLEFLIAASANPQGPVALCTTDRGLAEFWLALSPTKAQRDSDNDINFKLKFDKKLMPRLSNDQLAEIRPLV